MDVDMGQSDMSRLTTMLTRTRTTFVRGLAGHGQRTVEVGGVEFLFDSEGTLTHVSFLRPPPR